MNATRRTSATVIALLLLPRIPGNGSAAYLCIGLDGHVGVKTSVACCRGCCGEGDHSPGRPCACSPGARSAGADEGTHADADACACIDVPISLDDANGPAVPSRVKKSPAPPRVAAEPDHVASPSAGLVVADRLEPPWRPCSAAAARRTIVLLI